MKHFIDISDFKKTKLETIIKKAANIKKNLKKFMAKQNLAQLYIRRRSLPPTFVRD